MQKVYNLWVDNSISSTDGNGRNMVNISKRKFLEVYGREMNHKVVNLECHTTKRGQTVFSANQRVATCTVQAMKAKLESENCKISYGSVLFLKPFFRLMRSWHYACASCVLNTHLLFEPLVAQGKKDETESVSSAPCWKNI